MHLSASSLCFLLAFLALLPWNGSSRRLCGQVLTNELKRVCTKQGMKGPCLHGATNFAPVQKRRRGGDSLPHPRLPPLASALPTMPLFFAQFIAENKKAVLPGRHFALRSLKRANGEGPWQKWHLISRRNGEYSRWPAVEEEEQREEDEKGKGVAQLHNLLRAKRAKGIVDKCCSAEGCDDTFLDSFCCDEAEEKAFRANHKV